VVKKIIPVVPT